MRAGALRQRVVLQATSPHAWDVHSATAPGPTTLATVWAEVLDVRYVRQFGDTTTDDESLLTFRIRYRPDFAKIDRAVWAGRTFQVESVRDEDGRRRELLLECREHAP